MISPIPPPSILIPAANSKSPEKKNKPTLASTNSSFASATKAPTHKISPRRLENVYRLLNHGISEKTETPKSPSTDPTTNTSTSCSNKNSSPIKEELPTLPLAQQQKVNNKKRGKLFAKALSSQMKLLRNLTPPDVPPIQIPDSDSESPWPTPTGTPFLSPTTKARVQDLFNHNWPPAKKIGQLDSSRNS